MGEEVEARSRRQAADADRYDAEQPREGGRTSHGDVSTVTPGLWVGTRLMSSSSSHDSPRYGQHYTAEEVIEIFAPAQKVVDTIRQWLEDAGIAAGRISQSANKQWIQFDADVEEAEQLFQTEYHVYEHLPTGKTNIACDEYVHLLKQMVRS